VKLGQGEGGEGADYGPHDLREAGKRERGGAQRTARRRGPLAWAGRRAGAGRAGGGSHSHSRYYSKNRESYTYPMRTGV
jgi:hypothetical protein